jgi:hypothetical protein
MSRMISQIRLHSNLNFGRALAVVATISLAAATPFANAQAKRFPVTTDMILSAMQQRQLSIDGVQVRISAPVTAAVPNPSLDIQNFSSIDRQNAQIRIGCRNHNECISFYVAVTWPAQPSAQQKPAEQGRQSTSNTDVEPSAPGTTTTTFPAEVNQFRQIPTPSPVLRAGTPVTLVMENGPIHIRLHVISLQNGTVGETVRVSTPDRKQTFTAEILAPNLLKGSL